MRALIAEKNWKFKFPSNMEAAISSQFLIVSRRSTWSMREFLHSSLFHFSFEVDWTWFHGRYLLSVIKYVAIDSETFHFKQFSQKKIWNYFFCSNVSIDFVSWWGAADWVHFHSIHSWRFSSNFGAYYRWLQLWTACVDTSYESVIGGCTARSSKLANVRKFKFY